MAVFPKSSVPPVIDNALRDITSPPFPVSVTWALLMVSDAAGRLGATAYAPAVSTKDWKLVNVTTLLPCVMVDEPMANASADEAPWICRVLGAVDTPPLMVIAPSIVPVP